MLHLSIINLSYLCGPAHIDTHAYTYMYAFATEWLVCVTCTHYVRQCGDGFARRACLVVCISMRVLIACSAGLVPVYFRIRAPTRCRSRLIIIPFNAPLYVYVCMCIFLANIHFIITQITRCTFHSAQPNISRLLSNGGQ